MKLARRSPHSSRRASHAQSRTSVLRPGTALKCWGFTTRRPRRRRGMILIGPFPAERDRLVAFPRLVRADAGEARPEHVVDHPRDRARESVRIGFFLACVPVFGCGCGSARSSAHRKSFPIATPPTLHVARGGRTWRAKSDERVRQAEARRPKAKGAAGFRPGLPCGGRGTGAR
jgi:hypothetical protein